mmetsp:Transcript_18537/g.29876  ORF Transcript_18537/g.29876 Transcript_18537/m.29876 type:complete len:80 (+) Transcript_18537:95-334(+)
MFREELEIMTNRERRIPPITAGREIMSPTKSKLYYNELVAWQVTARNSMLRFDLMSYRVFYIRNVPPFRSRTNYSPVFQ